MQTIPLIEPSRQTMTLTDGRLLTWQEFGEPDGKPVLYFHGGGSLSSEAGIFHREAFRNSIRLISTNRPGTGGSTACAGRPIAAYSEDVAELLDHIGVDDFACFGESNGGMVALSIAATMSARVLGAVPVNPTLPWFDPVARRMAPSSAAMAYRLIRSMPWLVAKLAAGSSDRVAKLRSNPDRQGDGSNPLTLMGPPPGTEPDIADIHWRVMEQVNNRSLLAELKWAMTDWGFDYYAIPVALDIFCGVHDPQAAFALLLADRNVDARFHYFSFGHHGFSHPDARERIVATTSRYFDV